MSQEKPTNTPGKINRNHKDIKKLLDLGVQRGFLSYIEVHELLPPEMVSSEEVDEVMVMLAENEIEVTDGRKRAEEGDEKEEDSPPASSTDYPVSTSGPLPLQVPNTRGVLSKAKQTTATATATATGWGLLDLAVSPSARS
jgi:hypothetical protein